MVILVLAQSMENSLKMCSKFEEQMHVCAPIQDIQNLMEFLDANRESKIDLLFCDYYAFSSNTFNPYVSMRELLRDKTIPFVFYNDPLLPSVGKWNFRENSILNYYAYSSSLDITGPYRAFFMWVSIDSGMQWLLHDEPEKKEVSLMKDEDELLTLSNEIGITNSRLALLKYFWKNQNVALCSDGICKSVWNKNDDSTLQKLYTYISNLRQAFYNCIKFKMQIIRSGKNRYIFSAQRRNLAGTDFNVRDFMNLPLQYKIEFN